MTRKVNSIIYFMIYIVAASFNYFFVKFALRYSSPLPLMSIRYAVAGIILIVISLLTQGGFKFIINRDMVLLTVFSAMSSSLWAYGLLYVDPASSAVFSYTMPFFALILSTVLINERPRLMNIIGVVIGFVGVLLYAESYLSSGFSLLGAVLTITNAVFWALYSIYFRKLGGFNGLSVTAGMFIYGSIIMALASLALYGLWSFMGIDWGNIDFIYYLLGASIIGGAVLFFIWYLIVNVMGVSNAVSYIFAVPALTLLLNYLIIGMRPTPLEILGSGVMFLGIYLSSLR